MALSVGFVFAFLIILIFIVVVVVVVIFLSDYANIFYDSNAQKKKRRTAHTTKTLCKEIVHVFQYCKMSCKSVLLLRCY